METLWDEPFINNSGAIADFPANDNNSVSLKFKTKIAGKTGNDGTKNFKIRVPLTLKYLSNFWRSLEVSLIDCEINLILAWSDRYFITDNPIANQEPTFTITDAKLYALVVILSTQYNAKLLQQLKSGFKRTINWNTYKPKVTVQQQKW